MVTHVEKKKVKRAPPRESHPNLRMLAKMFYCFTDQDISIAAMSRMVPFNAVSQKVLEYWSATDHWAERRRQAQEEIEARVQKEVSDRVVKKRIELLDRLEQIESQILDECIPGGLKFRSKEGAISAYVRLSKFTDKLHEKVLEGLTSGRGGTPDKLPTPKLTTEEARAAARAILEARRKHGELTGRLESAP